MKKILLTLSTLVLIFLYASQNNIYASSNIETSANSNFTSLTTDFSSGQTIHVRVSANNNGDTKHELNLRDNAYNHLATYNLSKENDKFKTSFSAPQNEGYYSLEAHIESNGSKSTSVKTIKIGSPTNANVKVNVHTNVEGQSVIINSTPKPSPSPQSQVENIESPSPSPIQGDVLSADDVINDTSSPQKQPNLFLNLTDFFKKLWERIWPFK